MLTLLLRKILKTAVSFNTSSQELQASIARKTADYKGTGQKAYYGLPIARVGCTFATKEQLASLEDQIVYDFNNVHHSL